MTEQSTTVTCEYCAQTVGKKRHDSHIKNRCPKSPFSAEAIKNRNKNRIAKIAKVEEVKKIIKTRSRLERLYKDIRKNPGSLDNQKLAGLYLRFYECYVLEENNTSTEASVWAVSGGLPSLGKGAK